MGWLTDLADTAMADVAAARNSLEVPALAAAPIARANAAVGLPPLYPASESRRQKVLAILARDGGHYATLVEDPNTDPVVMAVATPGQHL